jgi:hypothetical protein
MYRYCGYGIRDTRSNENKEHNWTRNTFIMLLEHKVAF